MKCLQFYLWDNCIQGCDFCFLSKDRVISNTQEKKDILAKTCDIVREQSHRYDTIGLMGGEFFQGQIDKCEEEFFELIRVIRDSNVRQVWLSATLTRLLNAQFYKVLEFLRNKSITICTSWDYQGRFKEGQKEIWEQNIKSLLERSYFVNVTIILTQAFIDKIVKDHWILDSIPGHKVFRLPTTFLNGILGKESLSHDEYRKEFKKNLIHFPQDFAIKDKLSLYKVIKIIYNKFGIDKIRILVSNSNRSDDTYLMNKGIKVLNRKINKMENAPCGHQIFNSFCYENEDTCVLCDIKKFLNELEGK